MNTAAASTKPVTQRKKQAVIILHGIGEQRPMETLRSFVDTVWTENASLGPQEERETWLTPDEMTGSLELRRFTTSHHNNTRTDFFEMYWADLMQGTTTQQVWSWVSNLLLRWPNRVPGAVFSAWIMLWVMSLAAVGFFLGSIFGSEPTSLPVPANFYLGVGVAAIGLVVLVTLALKQHAGASGLVAAIILPLALGGLLWWFGPPEWIGEEAPGAWRLIPMAISAGLGLLIHNVLVPYLGDISRYVRAAPDTVASRKAVRERGLALLKDLHKCRRYRRIVFVAHSLGCIIAYDMISEFWATHGPHPGNPAGPKTLAALAAIGDAYLARKVPADEFDTDGYKQAQRAAFEALRSENDSWLISDFVTLGCPLTHAEFLLVKDKAELARAKTERLMPVSPPLPDNASAVAKGTETPSLLYALTQDERDRFQKTRERNPDLWFPHHAAPFAVVRWTNIFHQPRAIFFGDFISGPIRQIFGFGITDEPVSIKRPFLFGAKWSFFTHTLYWDLRNAKRTGYVKHIEVLRKAIALGEV